jgi:hypothetical protein
VPVPVHPSIHLCNRPSKSVVPSIHASTNDPFVYPWIRLFHGIHDNYPSIHPSTSGCLSMHACIHSSLKAVPLSEFCQFPPPSIPSTTVRRDHRDQDRMDSHGALLRQMAATAVTARQIHGSCHPDSSSSEPGSASVPRQHGTLSQGKITARNNIGQSPSPRRGSAPPPASKPAAATAAAHSARTAAASRPSAARPAGRPASRATDTRRSADRSRSSAAAPRTSPAARRSDMPLSSSSESGQGRVWECGGGGSSWS